MKQYGIYIRCNGGTPYMIHFFDDIYSAKLKLYEMIDLEEERCRPYFVDNDFFKNKYSNVGKLKYYRIYERNVSDWITYSKEEEKKENNILFLNEFRKTF